MPACNDQLGSCSQLGLFHVVQNGALASTIGEMETCARSATSRDTFGNMPLEKAEEVMSLTTDKSCSASRMLAEIAEITDEIKVIARKS